MMLDGLQCFKTAIKEIGMNVIQYTRSCHND
jgi:hypothetical protein